MSRFQNVVYRALRKKSVNLLPNGQLISRTMMEVILKEEACFYTICCILGTLMECEIHEVINYLRLPSILKEQKIRVRREIEKKKPKKAYPGLM